ncbi:MAG: DUF1566 domain-containing protein [Gammaproteobacteria bacterium]|nr:DUF1566 domain-containing protein [Gammaproteobacteria bacterium]
MGRTVTNAVSFVLMLVLLAGCGGGGGSGDSYTVSTNAGAGGNISPASRTVSHGSTASFTVTPDSGYQILSVDGCDGTLDGGTYTTGAITADCTVTAAFSPNSYTVSTSAGPGGEISPASRTVSHGSTAIFTVTPDSGYQIVSVDGCDGTLDGGTYTTGAIIADCTVTASFAAVLPTVSVADAAVLEGNSGTTSLVFAVTLSTQANGDVTVDYATSSGSAAGGAGCTIGVDYITAADSLTIASGTTSGTIAVQLCGETVPEADETFTLTLSNVSANAVAGTLTATGTITNDDAFGKLNDTGITACGDYAFGGSGTHNNDVDCAAVGATTTASGTDGDGDPVPAGQDAHFGRDANPLTNDDADGKAGFSFTKLDSSGDPLADQTAAYATTPWSCVLDNVTGLMWEVKTDDNGLHDKDWTYTWYNSDSATNGGNAGTANGGACVDDSNCDSEKYVAAVNVAGLCGFNDWRVPTQEELHSIADLGSVSPAIDTGFFPNTVSTWHWSSSPHASAAGSAWLVSFMDGLDNFFSKGSIQHVRLVRAGQ